MYSVIGDAKKYVKELNIDGRDVELHETEPTVRPKAKLNSHGDSMLTNNWKNIALHDKFPTRINDHNVDSNNMLKNRAY